MTAARGTLAEKFIGTRAESNVRRVRSHAGRLEEARSRTALPSRPGINVSNLGHLIWESSQVNKTKRQRPLDLTIHAHSSLRRPSFSWRRTMSSSPR